MDKKMNVLLAEDDKNLGTVLKAYLNAKSYNCTLCTDGDEASKAFPGGNFDFCILDVMMPVKDGFTVAKEIREQDKTVPILFLTAKSLEEDKLRGFDVGADDYLTKPFSMEELLVRMKAIIRRVAPLRAQSADTNVFQIGKLSFDFTRQILKSEDGEQKLTSKEAALLRLLCQHANQVLDRSEALKKIWNDDSYFNARSMDVYITKLRKYLRQDENIELMNVHGVGFKLITGS
jgi:DNA-binding response OmpR family regulator